MHAFHPIVVPLVVAAGIAGSAVLSPIAAQASGGHIVKAAARGGPASLPPAELAAIRAAAQKYGNVNAALADGYVRDPSNMCVTSEMEGAPRQLGAMGVHYFRPDLLGLAGDKPRVHGTGMHTDFLQPAVLMYEPQADGSHSLVGIENLVWAKSWKEAGNTAPPNFHGHDYFYMHDNPDTEADEAHGFEPHYELHFWIFRDNPNGMFAPFNPDVTCEHQAH